MTTTGRSGSRPTEAKVQFAGGPGAPTTKPRRGTGYEITVKGATHLSACGSRRRHLVESQAVDCCLDYFYTVLVTFWHFSEKFRKFSINVLMCYRVN